MVYAHGGVASHQPRMAWQRRTKTSFVSPASGISSCSNRGCAASKAAKLQYGVVLFTQRLRLRRHQIAFDIARIRGAVTYEMA